MKTYFKLHLQTVTALTSACCKVKIARPVMLLIV